MTPPVPPALEGITSFLDSSQWLLSILIVALLYLFYRLARRRRRYSKQGRIEHELEQIDKDLNK